MAWKVNGLMSQRQAFVELAQCPERNMAALCREYGITRPTGYKWLERGLTGALREQSRRPHSSPQQTDAVMEAKVLELRRAHPTWGGRKLRARLQQEAAQAAPAGAGSQSATAGAAAAAPAVADCSAAAVAVAAVAVPAASTITAILRRNELLDPAASARHTAFVRFAMEKPNQLWQMDFKGYFLLGDDSYVHPLTVLDDCSRYLLNLGACGNEKRATVQTQLTALFRTCGMPERMLMDNGAPWGYGPGKDSERLRPYYTKLTVWLLRLGIRVSHGRVRHPQTQGKDERLHRTLNEDLIQRAPPEAFANLAVCQRTFDAWRNEYNTLRPHEALNLFPPATRYCHSDRCMPDVLTPIGYPDHMTVRIVDKGGRFAFGNRQWRIGKAFATLPVGLAAFGSAGCYNVHFAQHHLANIDLTTQTLPIQCVNHVSEHL